LPEIVATPEEIMVGQATEEWKIVDDMVVYAGRLFLLASLLFWVLALEHVCDTTLVREYIYMCSVCQCNKTK
jgi:hypothetical protein